MRIVRERWPGSKWSWHLFRGGRHWIVHPLNLFRRGPVIREIKVLKPPPGWVKATNIE